MRALVTGGLGFIGSHLVDRLIADGWEVHLIDDASTHAKRPSVRRDVKMYVGSIHSLDWSLHTSFDAVFHLASKVGPVGVLKHGGSLALEVVRDADTVYRWARGAPLIYVSTSEVYGLHDGPTDEQQPRVIAAGHSARMEYAVGKLAAETMLLNRAHDTRIVRPFNVAGPRQRVDGGFVLPRFVAQALARERMTVYGDGSQERAFTHVADIVDGLMLLLDKGASHEVYNLGNIANRTTVLGLAYEVMDQMEALTRLPHGVTFVDPVTLWGPDFREAPDKLPDASKAISLGWFPTYGITQTVADVIADQRLRGTLVAERGPELFVRNNPGRVIPA